MTKKKYNLTIPGLSDDSKRFVEDLQKETDRGVALVAAEFIDDCLVTMLKACFVDDAKLAKELLKYPGSISTLAARIDLAYALGLLGKKMYADLKLIRKIRNEFGHCHTPVSFEEQRISDMCQKLQTMPWPTGQQPAARDIFIGAAITLAMQIMLRGLSCKHAQCGKDFKLAKMVRVGYSPS